MSEDPDPFPTGPITQDELRAAIEEYRRRRDEVIRYVSRGHQPSAGYVTQIQEDIRTLYGLLNSWSPPK